MCGRGKDRSFKTKFTPEQKAFINGKTDSAPVSAKKTGLGFSPRLETASGAGTHGGGKKTRNRRDRQKSKAEIREFK